MPRSFFLMCTLRLLQGSLPLCQDLRKKLENFLFVIRSEEIGQSILIIIHYLFPSVRPAAPSHMVQWRVFVPIQSLPAPPPTR